jgi:hypothetical protein
MSSPIPGTNITTHAIRQPHNIDLVLSDAHSFNQHLLLARRVEQQRDLRRGPR